MFIIRAGCTREAVIDAGLEEVRSFFTDIKNFVELMPGVESIHRDGRDRLHWKIRADIPLAGPFYQVFVVHEIDDSETRSEWAPVEDENRNLLHYSSEYLESKKGTKVHLDHRLELKRSSAADLHLLAGLAGETLISGEMQRRIENMLDVFIEKSRDAIENRSD